MRDMPEGGLFTLIYLKIKSTKGHEQQDMPLCAQGADVNEADARGITALGLAVGYNKVPLVKVLLEGGADVSKTDAKGSTVLHYAAGGCLLRCKSVHVCVCLLPRQLELASVHWLITRRG